MVYERQKGGHYAVTYWKYRQVLLGKPEPSSAELDAFKAQLKARVEQYIAAHPGLEEGKKFWLRHLTVDRGMTKEEVQLLLGSPQKVFVETAELKQAAGKFWSELDGRTREGWLYEAAFHGRMFTYFFDASGVIIDIVMAYKAAL